MLAPGARERKVLMANKVILVGNLGKDPELSYTQGGTARCKFSVATSETRIDKNGEKVTQTDWHNVVVWGKQGENCDKYLSKGSKVFIDGKVEYRSWEYEGQTKYMTEIKAFRVEFLGGGQRDGGGDGERQGRGQDQSREQRQDDDQRNGRGEQKAQRHEPNKQEEIFNDDNIPF